MKYSVQWAIEQEHKKGSARYFYEEHAEGIRDALAAGDTEKAELLACEIRAAQAAHDEWLNCILRRDYGADLARWANAVIGGAYYAKRFNVPSFI